MTKNFKLALNAGHYKYTAGKRCHADIDPNQTREWVLNDRICDKIENILFEYDGVEVLRIDDTTGETDISLTNRTNKANKWGADFWLGIHHNAVGKKFSGGGIVAYVYTYPSAEALEWQKALYNASVKATGLYGNRSTPLAKGDLHEVRETKMPAVLMECGFMDSTVDCPIILTEDFANKIAKAFADVIIEKSGATKRQPTPEPEVSYVPQIGDVVEYIGAVHYSSANSTSPKDCKPGEATVTRTYNGKHPYHLINTSGDKDGVYGWVDGEHIKKLDKPAEKVEGPKVEIELPIEEIETSVDETKISIEETETPKNQPETNTSTYNSSMFTKIAKLISWLCKIIKRLFTK